MTSVFVVEQDVARTDHTATVEQLDTLPGVGPVLAQHILDFRTRNGGYTSVDQLREVKGIGPKRFDDIRPLVQP